MPAITSFYFKARGLRRQAPHRRLSAEKRQASRAGAAAARPDAALCWPRSSKKAFEIKLAAASAAKRRRDILFFTQELSTLLNAGVPLDRALSITSELTERPQFPHRSCSTFCGCSRAASRWPTAWRRTPSTSPICTSTWCAPAKPAAAWRAIFERLTEFERTRDDLRSYIVSSMIYPGCWPWLAWDRSSFC